MHSIEINYNILLYVMAFNAMWMLRYFVLQHLQHSLASKTSCVNHVSCICKADS